MSAGVVGIVGLGVMGGSLARALSMRGVDVRGYSPDPLEARAAREAGAVSRVCGSVAESARGVDWWIVATPLSALGAVFAAGAPEAPPRVMDLASLQGPALAAAASAALAPVHVSAHPMTGRERSGFEASVADLYRDAAVWLTPGEGVRPGLLDDARGFWSGVDARPAEVGAREHDARMALVSHLPQLTANALARVLEERGARPGDLGPGGRDMTRLAASAPALWRDLLVDSGPDVAPLLRELAAGLSGLADRLEAGDVEAVTAVLHRTRTWRAS